MLKNYALQRDYRNNERFLPVFPGKYMYFDKYFQNLSTKQSPLCITIHLFEGRVQINISNDEKKIIVSGDKSLATEVSRHLYQLPHSIKYSIEVL